LRSISYTRAFSGEMYRTRTPGWLGALQISRSMQDRKAASVFPDPVGASSRVLSPSAMCGQPCSCTAVGASKASLNQARVAG
jgi:hypothetical protein